MKREVIVTINDVRGHIENLNEFLRALQYKPNEEFRDKRFNPNDHIAGILESYEIFAGHENNPVDISHRRIRCENKEHVNKYRLVENELKILNEKIDSIILGNCIIDNGKMENFQNALIKMFNYTHGFSENSFYTADGNFKLTIVKNGRTCYPQ